MRRIGELARAGPPVCVTHEKHPMRRHLHRRIDHEILAAGASQTRDAPRFLVDPDVTFRQEHHHPLRLGLALDQAAHQEPSRVIAAGTEPEAAFHEDSVGGRGERLPRHEGRRDEHGRIGAPNVALCLRIEMGDHPVVHAPDSQAPGRCRAAEARCRDRLHVMAER